MKKIISILAFLLVVQLASGAIVTRYFSTSSAGAGDGTTWADRAALFSGGNWSTEITGFDFSGSDSLVALIGPGTYTCSQDLAVGLFANAPSVANPLMLAGCDSSGNPLTPPDPNWTADLPDWDSSGLPIIETTTNIAALSVTNTGVRLLRFTASGRTGGAVIAPRWTTWCFVENSAANTSAGCLTPTGNNGIVENSIIKPSGSSYAYGITLNLNQSAINTRVVGIIGSSGNRHGIAITATSAGTVSVIRCISVNNGGSGLCLTSASANPFFNIKNCVLANNGVSGVLHTSTASLSASQVANCMITGNGAYGINGNSNYLYNDQNRLRDNASGNTTGLLNYPIIDSYTTDSSDADEYVNAAAGNYQIKATAAIWGMGFGVSEQCASAGGQRSWSQ